MRKKALSLILILILIIALGLPNFTTLAADEAVSVLIDGRSQAFEVPPQIVNGRTMVPLRAIFEALGALVDWNETTRTATATSGDTVVVLTLESTSPTVNGKVVAIDQPGVIIDGRILAPLRFVGEAFGGKVDWNEATRTASITGAPGAPAPAVVPGASGPPALAAVPGGEILIAAAASLQNAFEGSLIPEFNKLYPDIKVTGTYASSGTLQTQIESGLEADVFFSAATTQMNNLRDKNLIDESSVVNLLENKIVLIGTKGVKTAVTGFENITNAGMIAIGDPASVPAGQYAREVFASLGNWDEVLKKSSLGSNVTEVLAWVAAGSAEVGVVYATDAASNENVEIIAGAPPGSLQTPVLYPVALTADSKHKPQAQAFLDFLKGDAAKAIFESYGFSVVR